LDESKKKYRTMDATTAAVSVAAITGLAAYVNGKYHVAQDLKVLGFKRRAGRYYAETGMFIGLFTINIRTSLGTHLQEYN
jgi:predicted lysophospholipase L1 biosynthesis ABC-type transport system permease subunit